MKSLTFLASGLSALFLLASVSLAQGPWPAHGVVQGPDLRVVEADGSQRLLFGQMEHARPLAATGTGPARLGGLVDGAAGSRRPSLFVDANGNGVVDATESAQVQFTRDPIRVWSATDDGAAAVLFLGNTEDLVRFRDLDGDGLFTSPGEETLIRQLPGFRANEPVLGASFPTDWTISRITNDSSSRFRGRDTDSTLVAYPIGAQRPMIVRIPDVGAARNWLDFATQEALPGNVYFSQNPIQFSAFSCWFALDDASALDRAMVAVETGPGNPGIEFGLFDARDLNGDGDANDSGETVPYFFINSTTVPGSFGPVSIDVHGSSTIVLLVNFAQRDQGLLLSLEDLNGDGDAMDLGESASVAVSLTSSANANYAFIDETGGFANVDTCTEFSTQSVGAASATGGSIGFSLAQIPVDLVGVGALGITLLTADLTPTTTWADPVGACQLGIAFDGLTFGLLGAPSYPFVTGPIVSGTQSTGTLTYPAGIPVGTELRFASVVIGPRVSVSRVNSLVFQ